VPLDAARRFLLKSVEDIDCTLQRLATTATATYDAVHKDYIYTPAWVDFLAEKLIDQATYDLVLRGIAPAVA
jgi:hypothetical protein